MVIAVVSDLLFRAKIEQAAASGGTEVRVAPDASSALRAVEEAPGSRVLIDLNVSVDPIALIRALRQADPTATLIGYGSHVEAALHARAREAGCASVLARSAFVQRLPALLADPSRI